MRREAIGLIGVLGLAGCNEHRYGFFGDEDGGTTSSGETTGRDPDPSGAPVTVTVTTQSPPDSSEPDPSGPDSSEPDPSGPSTITVTEPDPTGAVPGVCGERVLPPEVPLQVSADSSGAFDLFGSSCNPVGANEAVFVWTAPFDGVFRFDTAGSSFDTVLTVLAGNCGGPELGCNDDALGVFSAFWALMSGGQTVTIVVEGRSGEQGPIVLNIQEEVVEQECTFADIGSDLTTIFGDTTFGVNVMTGSCGGEGASEAALLWTAPFAGMFRFETSETSFDPVLYMRLGGCDGQEILCSDDINGFEAGFEVFLTPEDGPVLLVVDAAVPGAAGPYQLKISQL